MNPYTISLIIGGATFLVTTGTTLLIVGVKWGSMKSDVENLKSDIADLKGIPADVAIMKLTLARIEGMFQLKLRE